MTDVLNGIKCNYVQVNDGNWIPIEESGDYYYLSDKCVGEIQQPTIQVVRKYISLIIQDEIRNPEKFNPESLIEYLKNAVMVLPDKKEQDELVEFFTKSLNVVKNTIKTYGLTPALSSAAKQAYQTYASPASGI